MTLTADIRERRAVERALGAVQGLCARFRDRLLGIVSDGRPGAEEGSEAVAEEVEASVRSLQSAFNLNFEGATLFRLRSAVARADIRAVLDALNGATRHESSEGVSPIFDDIPEADLALCRDAQALASYRARLAFWKGLQDEPDGKTIQKWTVSLDGSRNSAPAVVDFRFRLERLTKLGHAGTAVMRAVSQARYDAAEGLRRGGASPLRTAA